MGALSSAPQSCLTLRQSLSFTVSPALCSSDINQGLTWSGWICLLGKGGGASVRPRAVFQRKRTATERISAPSCEGPWVCLQQHLLEMLRECIIQCSSFTTLWWPPLSPRKRATFLKRTAKACGTWWGWIFSYLFYLNSNVYFGHCFTFLQHVLRHPVLLSYIFIPKICKCPRILL